MSAESPRRMRADARRNYERLLAEAETAFAERGADASLEDIARRADVGIGTLYRHFPTRMALLEAVYVGRIEHLHRQAHELLDSRPPDEAMDAWLEALIWHHTRFRGLKDLLVTRMAEEGSALSRCRTLMRSAAAALLERAQQAGQMRADLEAAELLRLVHAAVIATEHLPDHAEQARRMLALVMEGVRQREPARR
jgi:AcrR family transcriptional regulator